MVRTAWGQASVCDQVIRSTERRVRQSVHELGTTGGCRRSPTRRVENPEDCVQEHVPAPVLTLMLVAVRLTARASAAATSMLRHYPAFLRPEATASCMRLLGTLFSLFRSCRSKLW